MKRDVSLWRYRTAVAVIERVDDEDEEGPVLPCIRAFRVSSQSGKTLQIGVSIKFNG